MFMPKTNRLAITAMLMLSVCAVPQAAAQSSDFYATAYLGYDQPTDLEVDAGPLLDELSLERSLSYGVAVGRPIWETIRIEAEFVARSADADALSSLNLNNLGGSLDLQTLMLNAVADFALEQSSVVPYLGLGIGWANVKFDDIGTSFVRLSGDDDAFALQGIAGLAFPVSEQLTLSLDARYLRTNDVAYTISAGESLQSKTDVETVGLNAGIRFQF